ncbi:MAG: FHA domain-containing protein, partial [Limisphaerales bacterium]
MSAINNNSPGSDIKRGPRLLLQRPGEDITEWLLQPGANTVGRAAENHIQIDHPSVSSAHCSITVNGNALSVRDFGSTNGTFVEGVPIAEGRVEDGQTIRVGQVEMTVRFDAWATSSAAPAEQSRNSSQRQPATAPKPVQPEFVGAQTCKFHPKMAARYQCSQCGEFFCDACVALRQGGRPFCRHCGLECAPVLARLGEAVEKGFLARLPDAFAYPVRGAGVVVVMVGIVLFGLLKAGEACLHYRNLRVLIFGIIVEVFAGGYLFAFLQN